VDNDLALIPEELEKMIKEDIQQGFIPLAVVAAIGTTGTTAVDPIEEIGNICERYNIWLHIDAAYAGTALILPEYRRMIKGIEKADSYVFNPHKWMFTNFDCTAYFVKDPDLLIKTFEILPEYLKTNSRGKVNDYRDWGIPMGRRFRALKLWFVIRNFGVKGLQDRIRKHIELARKLESWIIEDQDFEMMATRQFNLVCFRYHPWGISDGENLDELNSRLENELNESGRMFLTHTRINGRYSLRMVIGQTYVELEHVKGAWGVVKEAASLL
jgi:aromatic-L-amino-acid decarboxylase